MPVTWSVPHGVLGLHVLPLYVSGVDCRGELTDVVCKLSWAGGIGFLGAYVLAAVV